MSRRPRKRNITPLQWFELSLGILSAGALAFQVTRWITEAKETRP